MILYLTPDQVLPLSGALGTVVGLALMFWGKLQELYRKVASRLTSKSVERP
ncbi:MAG TPA: hypothetical protein VMV61_13580 [Patescibacteria group bacterium]|nr:hypothetical protein [Patescibacteria group bacterium]